MESRRGQGRPAKGEAQVGRERLVELAQQLLKTSAGKAIGRSDLAEAAQVTPALVNYYFRDQASLMEATTAPVISRAMSDLKRILRSKAGAEDRLRQLIRLFVSFNTDYASHLDGFLRTVLDDLSKEFYKTSIFEAFNELVEFFASAEKNGHMRCIDPTFLVFALWGICKMVAQNPMLPVTMFDRPLSRPELLDKQVDSIFELLSGGVLLGQAARADGNSREHPSDLT